MKLRPPLHLDVEVIERGSFGSPSTNIANITLYDIHYTFTAYLYVTVIKQKWHIIARFLLEQCT